MAKQSSMKTFERGKLIQMPSCTPQGTLLVSASVFVVVALASCSKTSPPAGPQAFPVEGAVTFRGKPAEGFRVVFNPAEGWGGAEFAPSGVTDADGRFQLHSYGENDGAPKGEYVVTFSWPQEVGSGDPDDAPVIVDRLRGAFSDMRRSKHVVTVKEGENKLEPFELP